MMMSEELLKIFCSNRNIKCSTLKSYRSAIAKYEFFHDIDMGSLVDEAIVEEDEGISLKSRKIKGRLLDFRSFLLDSGLAISTVRTYFSRIKTFYRHFEIELPYLNDIGLDEEYLYFNDDLYPLAPCRPEDFFRNGKGVLGFSRHFLASGMYKKICRNSDTHARKALGLKPSFCFVRPQHTCTPMFRSECEQLYSILEQDILASLTRVRTSGNLNQYLFLDYQLYKGRMVNEKISNKHYSVAVASPEKLKSFILSPTRNLMCVNDVHLSEERYMKLRSAMIEAFELKFPQKSRFEK